MKEIKGNGYKYEQMLIIPGRYDKKKVKEVINSILGDWDKQELFIFEAKNHGKKQLAYEIKKEKEAYYLQINFISKPEIIIELERKIRINDDVIKFITVKLEEGLCDYNKIINEDTEEEKGKLYYYNKYIEEDREKEIEDDEEEEEEL